MSASAPRPTPPWEGDPATAALAAGRDSGPPGSGAVFPPPAQPLRPHRDRRIDWNGWRAQSGLALGALAALLGLWWLVTDVLQAVPGYRFPDPAGFAASAETIIGRGYAGARC